MDKRRHLRNKLLLLSLVGILIGWFWLGFLSQPYIHVTTFLQIPFGEGKSQLSKFAVIDFYLQVRPITVTGFLSFDEGLNICLSDYRRGIGERFLFFDSRGQLKRAWLREDKTGTYSVHIALNPDGSIWVSGFEDDLPSFCVRKYDKRGQLILQFGEPRPEDKWVKPVTPEVKRLLAKRYHHRWGAAYRFGNAKIHGLWVDCKGRVYVLTEYPSLHIFDSHGNPLAVFDIDTDDSVTFKGDMGNLRGGIPTFVDKRGGVYTIRSTVEQHEIGRRTHTFVRHWVEVWEWEKGVKEVFSAEVPESGCVVGVDGKGNVYFSSFRNERIYQICKRGRVQKIFEPRCWFRRFLRAEWKKLFAQDPKFREEMEQNWQAWETERKRRIAENPSLREGLQYYRDVFEYALVRGRGPRVGHVAHVDKEGNLYLTLVTVADFQIVKVERISKLEHWKRAIYKLWSRRTFTKNYSRSKK